MTSLVYSETEKYSLSISVRVRVIRPWASLVQCAVQKSSAGVYLTMRNLNERGIVRSSRLDRVKLTLIKSDFD